MIIMRLSLMKAAHVGLIGAAYGKFGSFALLAKGGIYYGQFDIRGSHPLQRTQRMGHPELGGTMDNVRPWFF